jgi:hypothetical protein
MDSSVNGAGIHPPDNTFAFVASIAGEPIQLGEEGCSTVPYLLDRPVDQVF